MQKEVSAWLIIRTFGLVSLCIALFQAFAFLINVVAISLYEITPTEQAAILHLPNLNWMPFFSAFLFIILAVYFLSYGKTIHTWLLKEDINYKQP